MSVTCMCVCVCVCVYVCVCVCVCVWFVHMCLFIPSTKNLIKKKCQNNLFLKGAWHTLRQYNNAYTDTITDSRTARMRV